MCLSLNATFVLGTRFYDTNARICWSLPKVTRTLGKSVMAISQLFSQSRMKATESLRPVRPHAKKISTFECFVFLLIIISSAYLMYFRSVITLFLNLEHMAGIGARQRFFSPFSTSARMHANLLLVFS